MRFAPSRFYIGAWCSAIENDRFMSNKLGNGVLLAATVAADIKVMVLQQCGKRMMHLEELPFLMLILESHTINMMYLDLDIITMLDIDLPKALLSFAYIFTLLELESVSIPSGVINNFLVK
ncbi:hypothetical protein L1887_02376 [Cichorium endivia]|nr:hypothetical protein L1887_02376 [Cichorium endivia]